MSWEREGAGGRERKSSTTKRQIWEDRKKEKVEKWPSLRKATRADSVMVTTQRHEENNLHHLWLHIMIF